MSTLTIALEKAEFFPPSRVTDDTSILTLKNLVFEPLCRWDDGFVRPGLFSHWEHSDGGRRWIFHLRPNAMFHDGGPCVAEDILAFIAGIMQAVDTFGMKWSYARYLADARLSSVSRGGICVENPEPIADILDIFSEFFICRAGPDGHATIGTGPYRVTDYIPGSAVTLKRVTDGDQASTLIAHAVVSAEERYRRLSAGDVDVALNLERMDARLTFDPVLQWGRAVNTLSVMYYLNCFEGLFTNPKARLAINHAVNAQAIIDDLFHGLGERSSTIVSPFHLGFGAAEIGPIPYDADRAKMLFDEAGAGGELVIRTPDRMPEKALEISKFVQSALADIGIDARLDPQPDRPEYARQVGRKQIGDMAIFDSSPHSTYRILNDKISSATQAVWWQGYHDDEVERCISAANRAVLPHDRERFYGRALARLNANPPWLYLFHPVDVFAARNGLPGLSIDHKGVLNVA